MKILQYAYTFKKFIYAYTFKNIKLKILQYAYTFIQNLIHSCC